MVDLCVHRGVRQRPPVMEEQQGLWQRLKALLHPAEVEPVRRALGIALVGKNEDLWKEVGVLRELLRDLETQQAAQVRS